MGKMRILLAVLLACTGCYQSSPDQLCHGHQQLKAARNKLETTGAWEDINRRVDIEVNHFAFEPLAGRNPSLPHVTCPECDQLIERRISLKTHQ
jgi:hypothetical protein